MFLRSRQGRYTLLGVALLIVLSGAYAVGRTTRPEPAAAAAPLPEVGVIRLDREDVPVLREYPARTYARDQVEVRGRVDGFIERRSFDIGSDVRAGQVLYVLDTRPYEAEVERARGALAQATADVAQAVANQSKATADVARLDPLVREEAASRQELDDARTALQASGATVQARQASVEAARAQLRTAELNLEYATIRAPIGGRIGDSQLQVGGLVSRASAEPLTTIVPLDPIWVRFQIGESELLTFQRLARQALPIELVLNDGTVHPHTGTVENTLNGVNTRTGTMEVQARFRNPDHLILPGQFGRVRLRLAEEKDALLVPQRAVQELQGLRSVYVVGAGNKVQQRSIVTGERVDQRWVVAQGLNAGDTVIVEGVQKARPGATVAPRPLAAGKAAAGGDGKEQ